MSSLELYIGSSSLTPHTSPHFSTTSHLPTPPHPPSTSPTFHLPTQYAKAKESEGSYREAVTAYQSAREPDSVVRILLQQLNAPEEAVAIVRANKSVEGAKMVAK